MEADLVGSNALAGMYNFGQQVIFNQLKQFDKSLVHVGCAVDDIKALVVFHFIDWGLYEL